MKRQGFRDSVHTVSVGTQAFSQPTHAAAFVPPVPLFIDLFRALSAKNGRQLSQSQTARVVGLRFYIADPGTDEQTTTGLWVRGIIGWHKPTMARVAAHELAMKEWFGELEEDSPGLGAGRWRQFLVKMADTQPTLPEHSLDGSPIPIPFALVSAAPAAARDVFGEYNARFPVPPDLVGAGIAQRQFSVYASADMDFLAFNVAKGSSIFFGGLGSNVDPLARAASTAYTGAPYLKTDDVFTLPGHHLPVMCGLMQVLVLQAGPRALLAGNAFEAGSNTIPDQTQDIAVTVGVDIIVEGWHPLRRQKPGESKR